MNESLYLAIAQWLTGKICTHGHISVPPEEKRATKPLGHTDMHTYLENQKMLRGIK